MSLKKRSYILYICSKMPAIVWFVMYETHLLTYIFIKPMNLCFRKRHILILNTTATCFFKCIIHTPTCSNVLSHTNNFDRYWSYSNWDINQSRARSLAERWRILLVEFNICTRQITDSHVNHNYVWRNYLDFRFSIIYLMGKLQNVMNDHL